MERRLGIIAGSGQFPFFVCDEAQKQGYLCVVAGIVGETHSELETKGNVFSWFKIQEVSQLLSFLRENRIKEAVFAGKIDPRVIFKRKTLGTSVLNLLARGKDRSPETIIRLAIDYFVRQGIEIREVTPFISSAFCKAGVLTAREPSSEIEADIGFGWRIARKLADLDIGQAVVVKNKAIVAVEGMEGTDNTIIRAGGIAGDDVVIVKVCRMYQDSRIDLPAIGLDTIKALAKVKGRALCFEAGRMPFFQREEALALAEASGITVVAKAGDY
jgi:hypothetical protein